MSLFQHTHTLRAKQLAFTYLDCKASLAPINLQIEPGALLLLTGASGAGKSTLIRCLAGLIPHLYHGEIQGEVWLGDLRTSDTPLWQLSERAGLVFQNPATQMLALTVEDELIFGLENLGLARQEISRRVETVLTQFDLHALRRRSPQTLSGGEQQKVALAAIMARRPAILLLDEPFAMLDVTAASALAAQLVTLNAQGTTVVISEHRAEYLQHVPQLRQIHLNHAGKVTDQREIATTTAVPTPLPESSLRVPSTSAPLTSAQRTSGLNGHHTIGRALSVTALTVALGGRMVLDQFSFTIAPGELVAIVGRNGVGKTTLLRALAGLQPYEGDIRVADPSTNEQTKRNPELGLVFQNADLALFNPTVRDEILYRVTNPDPERYSLLLDLLGLRRYEATPPLLLSEGEKKRVALATILMQGNRDGLLLDEPSLGQDQRHKTQLLHLMRSVTAAGQFVLFTTHDLPLAAQADRLILLGETGIVTDGSPAEVLQREEAWTTVGLAIPDWFWQTESGKAVR